MDYSAHHVNGNSSIRRKGVGNISPKTAADLAEGVYLIQSTLASVIEDFLDRPEFSRKSGSAAHLKAEVGSRLINTKDGFGMCVRGGRVMKKIFS